MSAKKTWRVIVTDACTAPRSDAGFTLIEAIIVLIVASLILGSILPIVTQSTTQNARYGARVLDQVGSSLDERLFRQLVRSAVPPRQAAIGRPALTTVAGNEFSLEFVVRTPEVLGCASQGETKVVLSVENKPGNGGGQLICKSGFAEEVLATWPSGNGQFAFSHDGVTWRSYWSAEHSSSSMVEFKENLAQAIPVIDAPFLRFEVVQDGQRKSYWVEKAGSSLPVEIDQEAIFADNGAQLGDGF